MGIDALDCLVQLPSVDRDSERVRARRTLNLANLSLIDNPNDARVLLARAEALARLGRPGESGESYRHALEVAKRGSSQMLEAYYGLLTAMDDYPEAAEVQINTCLEALEVYPLDSQLLCGMGSYMLRSGRLDLAARSYEMAVSHGKVDPSLWHLADLADVAVTCWSLVLQLQGDTDGAETVLKSAIDERPDSWRLRRQLIEFFVKAARQRDALAQCQLLPHDFAWRREMPLVVRGATLVAGKQPAQGLAPLQMAFQSGCRDVVCLRWLAAANLALAKLADLELILTEWALHEPGNLEIAAFRKAARQRESSVARTGHARRVDDGAASGLPPVDPPKMVSPVTVLRM
jgi:tetratricopeptide (TPR) repeat protein